MIPFFSIIIPLYNKEKHIKNTLRSVLAQTFTNFEVIIVNDGSTDTSVAEVATIKDDRIRLFTIENKGVSHARNFGVNNSRSDFAVLLDADDFWMTNHLEDLYKLYKEFPNCGLYATAYAGQFNEKIITSKYNKIPNESNWSGIVEDFFESSKINCIASASSVIIPKAIFEMLGGFNTHYNSGEDIDLWIRIALDHQVAFTNKTSVLINLNADNQVSKRSINTRNHLDFDTFKEEKNSESLKAYLDLNRFSLAIQHKLAGNNKEADELTNKIDSNNLNNKQRILLSLHTSVLKNLIKVKNVLRKNGIALSASR